MEKDENVIEINLKPIMQKRKSISAIRLIE